jgi:ubiquitin-activating enzyme E1
MHQDLESDDSHPSKKSRPSDSDNMELDSKALNKFSRQNAALGAETTAKLIKMKVLIVGMRGIGIETAKNLALQGVGCITVSELR